MNNVDVGLLLKLSLHIKIIIVIIGSKLHTLLSLFGRFGFWKFVIKYHTYCTYVERCGTAPTPAGKSGVSTHLVDELELSETVGFLNGGVIDFSHFVSTTF